MSRSRVDCERTLEPFPKVFDAGANVAVEQVGIFVTVDARLKELVLARVEGLTGKRRTESDSFEDGGMSDFAEGGDGLEEREGESQLRGGRGRKVERESNGRAPWSPRRST